MSPQKKDIKSFILKHVESHPLDLARFAKDHFNISIQGIQKHIAWLLRKGLLIKEGKTRGTKYSLPPEGAAQPKDRAHTTDPNTKQSTVASAEWRYKVDSKLSEQDVWDKTLKLKLAQTSENIREIAEYGFTEMVNNVKDHSNASELFIGYKIINATLHITVRDDGIGIYRKLKDTLGLSSLHEAVLHLSKGKLTTDHTRHTGEGIFFSSRVFDKFFISANGLVFGRLNTPADEDWLLGEEKTATIGTFVQMQIDLNSSRTRESIFRRFTSAEDFSFSKTHVAVELGINEGETYVSRSQAKRILSGLEKFKFIVLNFKRVHSVGQGFVDEVFRVFKNAHPGIEITSTNENESVDFMIKRAKS